MKTIGVLGGTGPQATMEFEARFHRVAQQRIPQRLNTGYPPLIVCYNREPPFVLEESGMARLPLQLSPAYFEIARRLGPLVDFLVITANAPHLFKKEIEQVAGRPVLSMIDRTVEEVKRRGWKKVGVVGFGDPIVYTQPLQALGIACETLPAEVRSGIDVSIFHVMEGRLDPEERQRLEEGLNALRGRGVDGLVLGCTEFSVLLGDGAEKPDLLNPVQVLAEAAIERATT